MLMNLVEIKNYINGIHTPSQLELELPDLLVSIAAILGENNSYQVRYFTNHTGRELYKKLWHFGLYHLIPGYHDGGFRPRSEVDLINDAAGSTGSQLLAKFVRCGW